jgi:uncharacterized protein (TIGR03435 family)
MSELSSETMRRSARLLSLLLAASAIWTVAAQTPTPEFEVVSIKRNLSGGVGNSGRTLPDGTRILVNSAVRNFIMAASPVDAVDVEGLPGWAFTERYDVTAKPPAGATNAERRAMMQRMFADRFKLVAHIEERERDVYDLVLARDDGRLGPNLRPSTATCAPGAQPPPGPLTDADIRRSCVTRFGRGEIVSGGTTLASLSGSLRGLVGAGRVTDKTGLAGTFELELTFSPGLQRDPSAPPDDRPDIFTALREQLGLRLVRAKASLPVLVVDHIERPSPN